MDPLPKTLGKYQILDLLGQGGMGSVYKAYQPDLQRHVAVKTILSDAAASEEFVERFQREARLAAKLVHPNIVQIHDLGREDGTLYLVMELVEGRSLKQVLDRGPLDPDKSLRIALSVARTLQHAHELKIIHRDVKPANILIDRHGHVKVLDFGLAKIVGDESGSTLSGTVMGTPNYMSPEQAFGATAELDARTDIYSLGAVLYEMLTGRPPLIGATVLSTLKKIEEEEPVPPGVSPEIDALILKALAKDPRDRYQSAGEFSEAIRFQRKASGIRESVEEVPARRRRRRLLLAAASGLLLLVPVAWILIAKSHPREPSAELREMLAAGREPETLDRFPGTECRRLLAEHHLRSGRFGRAAPLLDGYDRFVAEMSSASALQRFVSPPLFPLALSEAPELSGAQSYLVSAAMRHREGRSTAADDRFKAATASGASPEHLMLVRSHMDFCAIWTNPQGEQERPVLQALRNDLAPFETLSALPLRALSAHLDGDPAAAWKIADRLLTAAPSAAETFLLRSLLHQREGNYEEALVAVHDSSRLDSTGLDVELQEQYLRFLLMLQRPESSPLDPSDVAFRLEPYLGEYPHPAALLLRTFLLALQSQWDESKRSLDALSEMVPLYSIPAEHPSFSPFLWHGGTPRERLLEGGREIQFHLRWTNASLATAELIQGEQIPEDQKKDFLRDNHRRIAELSAADGAKSLFHLEEALRLGMTPQEARDDAWLGPLAASPAFEELLRRYEP